MSVHLIQVPFDSGQRGQRMGRGPLYLVDQGAADQIRSLDITVQHTLIEPSSPFFREIGTTFELLNAIAHRTQIASAAGSFPLILAGNCNSTVGAISGLRPLDLGLIWFDAHGDFNTPETSTTGFLDGMGLSMSTGRCWKPMVAQIPGFQPLPDDRIALVGARDCDTAELKLLAEAGIRSITWQEVRARGVKNAFETALADLCSRVETVYVHIDLDVHDTALAPANHYESPGGLRPEEVLDAVRFIADRCAVAGASITAFDPVRDAENRTLAAALNLIQLLGQIFNEQSDSRAGT